MESEWVNEHFTGSDYIIPVSCGGLSKVSMTAVVFYFWKNAYSFLSLVTLSKSSMRICFTYLSEIYTQNVE